MITCYSNNKFFESGIFVMKSWLIEKYHDKKIILLDMNLSSVKTTLSYVDGRREHKAIDKCVIFCSDHSLLPLANYLSKNEYPDLSVMTYKKYKWLDKNHQSNVGIVNKPVIQGGIFTRSEYELFVSIIYAEYMKQYIMRKNISPKTYYCIRNIIAKKMGLTRNELFLIK
ncbi:Uncharacterised protein [Klebsiella pneumoniae]|nr:Uncharacterised protein [Klebsiella pneumoniae]